MFPQPTAKLIHTAADLQIQPFFPFVFSPSSYHQLLGETLQDLKSLLIFVETQNRRLISQRAVCLSSCTGLGVSNAAGTHTVRAVWHRHFCLFVKQSSVWKSYCCSHCLWMNDTLLYRGVNECDCCLSLSHSHEQFPSTALCKCAKLSFHNHCATHRRDHFHRCGSFAPSLFQTCTSQAANITQRNTTSVLEPDYTRHTQPATQLKGQGETQTHSG